MNDVGAIVLGTTGPGNIASLPWLWPLFTLIVLIILVKLIYHLYKSRHLTNSDILDIDRMGAKIFERSLEVLFKSLGYQLERTRCIGDYGANLVAVKDGKKTVIQARRHKCKMGIKAVQEALAAKDYYNCTEVMVVTNSFFTRQAEELARANGVELWERNHLVEALLSVKRAGAISTMAENSTAAAKMEQKYK